MLVDWITVRIIFSNIYKMFSRVLGIQYMLTIIVLVFLICENGTLLYMRGHNLLLKAH